MFYCAHKERRMNSGIQRTRNKKYETKQKYVNMLQAGVHDSMILSHKGLRNGFALAHFGDQGKYHIYTISILYLYLLILILYNVVEDTL